MVRIRGKVNEAAVMANEMLKRSDLLPRYRLEISRDLAWMLIEKGEATRALELLNLWIGSSGAGRRSLLLVDRARVKAILGKDQEAHDDIETFFSVASKGDLEYSEYADACLVRGFLREKRGAHAEAVEAWRKGLLRNWPGQLPLLEPGQPLLSGLTSRRRAEASAYNVMLISLTGESSEVEAENSFNDMMSTDTVAGSSLNPIFRFATRRVIPSVLLNSIYSTVYVSSRGHELARKIAFRQISLHDYIREPMQLGLYTAILVSAVDRELSFQPDKLGPEGDELVWRSAGGLMDHFDSRRLTNHDAPQLALAWLGLVDPASAWKSFSPHLDAELSQAVGYGMGRRALVLKKDKSSAELFRAVVGSARPGSYIHRVARAELEHLESSGLKP